MLHAAHNLREWYDRKYLKLTFLKQSTVYFQTSNWPITSTLCKQNTKWRVVGVLAKNEQIKLKSSHYFNPNQALSF